jgi:tRNA threonylcarbamoyladenosine biosynthesis protein TsaB
MELAIDTSTRYASVAVADCGAVVVEQTWRSGRNHSVELVPAVRRVMALAGAKMDRLAAIYVASGPGGFSALRVGMSTAKAISAAVGAPLVAVPTLDVEEKN